jgi:hypothetical protein
VSVAVPVQLAGIVVAVPVQVSPSPAPAATLSVEPPAVEPAALLMSEARPPATVIASLKVVGFSTVTVDCVSVATLTPSGVSAILVGATVSWVVSPVFNTMSPSGAVPCCAALPLCPPLEIVKSPPPESLQPVGQSAVASVLASRSQVGV